MWHMGDGWGWWMVFGTVIMVAFWLMIIWAIGNLGRRPPHDTTTTPNRDEPTALEVLERRYANGDLTNEEFEEKRNYLNQLRGNGTDRTQAER